MKYQCFDIPTTFKDMVFRISETGVMKLTKSRFKDRHNKVPDLQQVPRTGFEITPKKKKSVSAAKKRKPQKSISNDLPIPLHKKVSPPKAYRIDKSVIKNRIQQYVRSMKGQQMLYFWTITFPAGTPDSEAHHLFSKWLMRMRKDLKLKDYLWISERQTGDRITVPGKAATHTLHFHVAINQRLCVKKANRFMRAAIMRGIDEKSINWTREAAMKYNGVDIAKDRKTKKVINFAQKKKEKSLSNYLTKYVTKNDESFQHLAWHNSRGYSNLIINVRLTEQEFLHYRLQEWIIDDNPLQTDYFTFYRWKGSPPKFVTDYFNNLNSTIINHILCPH